VERKSGGGWKRVTTMRANAAGIFTGTLRLSLPPSASMRARIAGASSIAFPLRLPRDMFVNPFGS
jgi:hypothetical protein